MHRRAGAKTALAGDKLASVVKRSVGETRPRVVGVGLGSLLALLKPEFVAVHFEDVNVMA